MCRKLLLIFFFSFFSVLCAEGKNREKRLVIIVPSYNNVQWYKRNLGSIFSQNYKNYRVIYIDDCSSDGTASLVEKYVRKMGQKHRFTLIKNKRRRGALYNRYKVIHTCDDNEIVLLVDGDDWLSDVHVFDTINQAYDDPDVWLTYGVHLRWPEVRNGWGKKVSPEIIQENAFRTLPPPIFIDHLRTFYAWLFKLIKLKDLLVEENVGMHQGTFYPTNTDAALLLPLIEMACSGHFKFIQKYLYIYNRANSLHVGTLNPKLVERLGSIIRGKKRYKAIQESIDGQCSLVHGYTDLFVVFSDLVLLHAFLGSLKKYDIFGVNTVCVLLPESIQISSGFYKKLKRTFPHIKFVAHADMNIFYEMVKKTSSQYVAIASDSMVISDHINFCTCARVMKQTFAHGFYFHMNKDVFAPQLPREELEDGTCIWMFKHEKVELVAPKKGFMIMYHKETMLDWLATQINKKLVLSQFLPKGIELTNVGLFL